MTTTASYFPSGCVYYTTARSIRGCKFSMK